MKAKLISFVIAETTRAKKGKEAVQSPTVKSAPHYFEATVPQQFIVSQETVTLREKEGQLSLKTYPPDVLIAEASFDLPDIFAEDVLELKEEAITLCRETLKKKGAKNVEELDRKSTRLNSSHSSISY